jgi:hypothetical protein
MQEICDRATLRLDALIWRNACELYVHDGVKGGAGMKRSWT